MNDILNKSNHVDHTFEFPPRFYKRIIVLLPNIQHLESSIQKQFMLLLITATLLGGTAHAQSQVKVTIHPDQERQVIHGFGASDAWRCQFVGKNWPLEKREQIADLLFSRKFDKDGNPEGIGLSIWRFYIGSGSTEQGDSSGLRDAWRRAECFQRPDGTYDWSKQEGQRWFLQAARKRGVEKFLAFTIAAPVHMARSGKAFNKGNAPGLNILPGKTSAYADFLVDVIEHYKKDEGITFDYLSPINEPQWGWEKPTQEGTPATNNDMYELTKALSHQLSARKLPTRVLLGEAGDIQYLYKPMNDKKNDRQIRTFFGANSPLNLNALPNVQHAITGHSYFTTWPVKSLIDHRKALRDTLRAVDPALEYWQTEFCILEKNEDIGGGGRRDLGINTALYFARVIHHDLVTAGASSWQFWTALSEADFKDGLIYLDNGDSGVRGGNDPDSQILQRDGFVRESKTLWALGNYSLFVRPGMKRVEVSYADETLSPEKMANDLMVSGFIDKKTNKLVLVAVNYSAEPRLLVIDKGDKQFSIVKNTVETFTTAADKDLVKGTSRADQVSIGPKSVVTMVGKLK